MNFSAKPAINPTSAEESEIVVIVISLNRSDAFLVTAEVFGKFLIILSLNVCFVRKPNGACMRAEEIF